jgi:hypothetical protein
MVNKIKFLKEYERNIKNAKLALVTKYLKHLLVTMIIVSLNIKKLVIILSTFSVVPSILYDN